MWVRGLKPWESQKCGSFALSHPMWVRGLKHREDFYQPELDNVAPYVGAWIETDSAVRCEPRCLSHPMWVRGLKPLSYRHKTHGRRSHPMWVRGLKQAFM